MIYLQKQVIFNIQSKVLFNELDKNLKSQRRHEIFCEKQSLEEFRSLEKVILIWQVVFKLGYLFCQEIPQVWIWLNSEKSDKRQ